MKLHFDSNQEYQIDAIRAVTDIFEGQPLNGGDFEFSLTATGALLSEYGVGNRLTLTEEQIWENAKRIQERGEKKIYFVAETKGKDQELRPSEKMKIACGKVHFEQFDGVMFKWPISSVSELV
ncbi:MAG: hypothetical protein M1510_11405 [Nitrospirae bacterium]|nr:hypothetical protein [Nitrospirota bacterium]MCL5236320.1 hypothetical protein [Nitrospirota bacterium]